VRINEFKILTTFGIEIANNILEKAKIDIAGETKP
jgi:hypothetical protein